eukprot:683004-Pelagomonas_calceolata.AAC.2
MPCELPARAEKDDFQKHPRPLYTDHLDVGRPHRHRGRHRGARLHHRQPAGASAWQGLQTCRACCALFLGVHRAGLHHGGAPTAGAVLCVREDKQAGRACCCCCLCTNWLQACACPPAAAHTTTLTHSALHITFTDSKGV